MADSVGSLSASLMAALRAAGEKADTEQAAAGGSSGEEPERERKRSRKPHASAGDVHVSQAAPSTDALKQAQQQVDRAASRVQAQPEGSLGRNGSNSSNRAPPLSRSAGQGGLSGSGNFMSLHSLTEGSISTSLKAALKAAGEKADREEAAARQAEARARGELPPPAWGGSDPAP